MKKVLYELWNVVILFFIGLKFIIGFVLLFIICLINWLYIKIFRKEKELIPITKWLNDIEKEDNLDSY